MSYNSFSILSKFFFFINNLFWANIDFILRFIFSTSIINFSISSAIGDIIFFIFSSLIICSWFSPSIFVWYSLIILSPILIPILFFNFDTSFVKDSNLFIKLGLSFRIFSIPKDISSNFNFILFISFLFLLFILYISSKSFFSNFNLIISFISSIFLFILFISSNLLFNIFFSFFEFSSILLIFSFNSFIFWFNNLIIVWSLILLIGISFIFLLLLFSESNKYFINSFILLFI